MSKPFNGKCPLCGGKLKEMGREIDHISGGEIIAKDNAIYLYCETGDYHCLTADFEAAWTKHAKAISDALEVLLTDLKNANLK